MIKIFKTSTKTIGFAFGSIFGLFLTVTKKLPNYGSYEYTQNTFIGKFYSSCLPLFDDKEISIYYFSFLRFW